MRKESSYQKVQDLKLLEKSTNLSIQDGHVQALGCCPDQRKPLGHSRLHSQDEFFCTPVLETNTQTKTLGLVLKCLGGSWPTCKTEPDV